MLSKIAKNRENKTISHRMQVVLLNHKVGLVTSKNTSFALFMFLALNKQRKCRNSLIIEACLAICA